MQKAVWKIEQYQPDGMDIKLSDGNLKQLWFNIVQTLMDKVDYMQNRWTMSAKK